MTSKNSYSLQKRKYAQISTKKRQALVRLVVDQGKSLSEAGRKLHVNPSTARLIIKKYRQTGTYFEKRLRNTPKVHEEEHDNGTSSENVVKQQYKQPQQVKVEEENVKREEGTKIETQEAQALRLTYPFLQYFYN